ncbi:MULTISPECIES: phage tail protein [unclassified Pseudomonas]|uniref:phage tail protein n=1 Tax=unclassified Pseudomonas TaxID=196821 RepID=UPI0009DA939D|nr:MULTISPECIES: tail fiber protein [unclassified Pseudomonas]MBD9517485.1 phage tail protein [Pseudomonas sp. PDM22]MBD9684614.1 phage tail protein [Pseudomonas sp. PDM20]OQR36327.1 phage tail protein [Pseudomonas sp. T]
MSEQSYLGSISGWAPNFAPRGWMICAGQILAVQQNSALFSLLGTNFGGNGQTTFGLPNLQGRVPVGVGQSPGTSMYALGQVGGTESTTLTTAQMPMHTHAATGTLSASLPTSTAAATSATPSATSVLAAANGAYGRDAVDVKIYAPAPGSVNLPLSSSATVNVQMTGGSQPFSILQPFQAINYIICVSGLYPSRN